MRWTVGLGILGCWVAACATGSAPSTDGGDADIDTDTDTDTGTGTGEPCLPPDEMCQGNCEPPCLFGEERALDCDCDPVGGDSDTDTDTDTDSDTGSDTDTGSSTDDLFDPDNLCINFDGGANFCGVDCKDDGACPVNFTCYDVNDAAGAHVGRACAPTDLSCDGEADQPEPLCDPCASNADCTS